MGKVVRIEVPEWIDEKSIREVVKNYVRSNLPDSLTKEEYVSYTGIDIENIVEFSEETELKILDETRKKAKKRCQY